MLDARNACRTALALSLGLLLAGTAAGAVDFSGSAWTPPGVAIDWVENYVATTTAGDPSKASLLWFGQSFTVHRPDPADSMRLEAGVTPPPGQGPIELPKWQQTVPPSTLEAVVLTLTGQSDGGLYVVQNLADYTSPVTSLDMAMSLTVSSSTSLGSFNLNYSDSNGTGATSLNPMGFGSGPIPSAQTNPVDYANYILTVHASEDRLVIRLSSDQFAEFSESTDPAVLANWIATGPGDTTVVLDWSSSFSDGGLYTANDVQTLVMRHSLDFDVNVTYLYAAVPEPFSALLLAVGGLAVVLRRRRR